MGEAKRKREAQRVSAAALPIVFTDDVKVRLADAIELTLADRHPHLEPFKLCHPRAAVTSVLLNLLTHSTNWGMQAGSLLAYVSDDDDFTVGWDYDAGVAEGREHGEIHAWARHQLDHTIVDSTVRHFPAVATLFHQRWTRNTLPVAWGSRLDLLSQRYLYSASPQATAELARLHRRCHQETVVLAQAALARFQGREISVFM